MAKQEVIWPLMGNHGYYTKCGTFLYFTHLNPFFLQILLKIIAHCIYSNEAMELLLCDVAYKHTLTMQDVKYLSTAEK